MGQTGMGMTTGNIWMNAAAGAASGIFDRLAQRIGVNYDQRKQYEQQEKLNQLQIQSESKLMDIQNQKQLEMWKATSYPAQVEMLRKAGLNPALLYGQAGGGGTTGAGMPSAMAGTAQSPNTHTGGMGIMQGAIMASQMQLQKAQADNLAADSKLKEAQAAKESGTGAMGQAILENLIANTTNTEAKTNLTKAQSTYQNIINTIKDATSEQEIANVGIQASIMMQELRSTMVKANVDTVTQETQINQIRANLALTLTENTLKQSEADLAKSGIKLNDATIQNMLNTLKLKYTEFFSGQEFDLENRTNEAINDALKEANIAGNTAIDLGKKILQALTIGGALHELKKGQTPTRNPIGFK